MIVCHPLKLIHIKTCKTSGTAFEIALSTFCSDTCIVTEDYTSKEFLYDLHNNNSGWLPESVKKVIRKQEQNNKAMLSTGHIKFRNHTSSKTLTEAIDRMYGINIEVNWWKEYKKITIHRNPFERFVSCYYDSENYKLLSGFNKILTNNNASVETKEESFGTWVLNNLNQLDRNHNLAPIEDMDYVIRYEHLEEDVKNLNIDGLWEVYSQVKCKTHLRPKESTVEKMYEGQRELVNIIIDRCKKEIEYFNYDIPEV